MAGKDVPCMVSKELGEHVAKALFVSSILVVGVHVETFQQPGSIGWWIARFFTTTGLTKAAVPLFFIVSGFFLAGHMNDSGWYVKGIRKRLRTLGIPYVVWNIIFWLFHLAIAFTQPDGTFAGVSCREFGVMSILDVFIKPHLVVLWYIQVLFLLILASPAFIVCKKKRGWILPIIGFGASCVAMGALYGHLPAEQINGAYRYLHAATWFSSGICLRYHPLWRSGAHGKGIGMCALSLAIVLLAMKFGMYGDADAQVHVRSRLDVVIVDTIDMLCIPLVIVAIWGLSESWRLSHFFRRLTFPLYVLHEFWVAMLLFIWRIMGKKDWVQHSITMYFAQILLIVLGVAALVALLRRMAPKLSNFLFGGR